MTVGSSDTFRSLAFFFFFERNVLAKNLVHDSHDPSHWRHSFKRKRNEELAPETPILRCRPAESSRKLVLPPQRANSTLRAPMRNISSPDHLLLYFVIIGERAGQASNRVKTQNAKVKVKEQFICLGLQQTLPGIN